MRKTLCAVTLAIVAATGSAAARPAAPSLAATTVSRVAASAPVAAVTKEEDASPAEETLVMDSRIDAVTAFKGRALIVRRAETGVRRAHAGNVVRLSVNGLPRTIEEGSLQARCHGPSRPSVVGVSIEDTTPPEGVDPEVKRLEREIQSQEDRRRVLTDKLATIEERRLFMRSLRDTYLQRVGKDDEKIDFKQWLEAQKMVGSGLAELAAEQRQLDLERRAADQEIAAAQKLIGDAQTQRNVTQRIVQIDVRPRRAGGVVCQVRYLVPGVTWSSTYDARLEEGALALTHFANVENRSGEDWKDVTLSVSTANPVQSTAVPELHPSFLRIYQPVRHGWRAPAAPSARGEMELARVSAGPRDQLDSSRAEAVQDLRERQEVAAFTQRELHVVYTAKGRATVRKSGAPRKLAVAEHGFEPELTYVAAPRVASGAYLTAKLKNGSRSPILAGEVRLFMGDDFVGKTTVPTVMAGDEVAFSFGRDERVKIERDRTSREQKTTGIFSKELDTREAYRVRIHNLVGRAIKVALLDSVPVPTDKRITVELDETSTPRSKADEKDRPGTLRWNLELSPGAKQEVTFAYRARWEHGLHVTGM